VFDIGANVGRFTTMIHKILPEASIYAFEPLKDCYEQLVTRVKCSSKMQAFNYALGDEDNEAEIHRSDYLPSSSILPMGDLHKRAFPFTKEETKERITVRRLDGIAKDLELSENILIKIDVQGFEDKVILGGKQLISKAKILIVETNFETLYERQPLFDSIYDMLKQMGFSYKGNLDQLLNPIDGRVLQADSIFIKES
jgi:FkbM family methyltransferase